ncbi:MAG: hypothetical protein L6243_02695 [Candidatus Altiarchaeales archaeon]|nr:hypothetical protein [Candidatus Altiarchaeota archaeon]MBU4341594.1 hypothetical protein [Candidatus Altiarchaeota archaeon]MBU4406982.1 hypothetical protein [Candidatus Altiarchaeota archaeon]MBU4437398.1 hypothetical protein [Candidatus Altiarchaeota archaeon]MCG2782475.1 hypothetical protein [Candidatus Altiarchaeales archaeon]
MDKLSQLLPGETISVTVRVLDEPEENKVNGRRKLKARVGDGDNIANLVAWDLEADRLNIAKDEILEIVDGECPALHKDTRHSPTLLVTKKTILKKKQLKFPSIQECMQGKFLDQISEYSYGIATGFINQVYQTASYFCERCKKFSDEMCDCGNFPKPIFRIRGFFSDGTKTLLFSTASEMVAEKVTKASRKEAKKINPKTLMDRPYTLLGYLRDEKFWVEDVIE